MRPRWRSLQLELKTKLQLLEGTLEQNQNQNQVPGAAAASGTALRSPQVFPPASRVPAGELFSGPPAGNEPSLKTLYDAFRDTVRDAQVRIL